MPIAYFWTTPDRLPDPRDRRYSAPNPVWTDLEQLTLDLLKDLPAMVASGVNEVDRTTFGPDEILVVAQCFHPWGYGATDIWIDLQPDARALAKEAARRVSMYRALTNAVNLWLDVYCRRERAVLRPGFDAEVRPVGANGCRIKRDGVAAFEW